MASYSRAEVQIESQIQKRIIPDQLTPNDLDFYVRKVRRLESDNNILQDELNKVRVRLRRAEDFEIKYEVLVGEYNTNKKQLEIKQKSFRDLKTLNQKLARTIQEKSNKHEEWGTQKKQFLQEIQKLTQKIQDLQIRRVNELATERARNQENMKRQILIVKKDLEDKEQQYKFQIRQLKKIILQKETVEAIVNNRVEKIRKQKNEEIARLGLVIEDQKQNRSRVIQEKNQEISRLKEKFQKMINFQLENIKKNLQDQGEVFSIQLNGLKEIIAIKNDQISKLLLDIKRQAVDHQSDRKGLLNQITNLKQKIYIIEREGELELFNLRQKLMEIQAADLKALEQRYKELLQTLREDKEELQNFIKQKQRLREDERKDYQRNLQELNDKIRERDQRISTLLDRIKQSGDLNTGQLKNLHESFHKIQAQKENLSSQYQNNITFMTQQIAKLTSSNEIKNAEMKKLYEQLHQSKTRYESEMKQVDARNKRERKERDQEKQRDRHEREQLAQDRITMQRDFKNAERRIQREKDKQQREKNKLKFIVEQLERDIERLNKYIKQLDDNLKGQYKKTQMNILDGDGSRREATSLLEKQKVEIETLKNIQIDQIKRKYQIQSARFLNQNERLKTELLNKSLTLQKAQTQLKKLDYQNRNIQKISRQKIMDYEKKMATLNNEINLTQQLYQTFLEAKSRKKQQ